MQIIHVHIIRADVTLMLYIFLPLEFFFYRTLYIPAIFECMPKCDQFIQLHADIFRQIFALNAQHMRFDHNKRVTFNQHFYRNIRLLIALERQKQNEIRMKPTFFCELVCCYSIYGKYSSVPNLWAFI